VSGGRQCWYYLESEEEAADWPQTARDKFFLGIVDESSLATHLQAPSSPLEALKRGFQFYKALQAEDGHWAGEYGGPLFLLPGSSFLFFFSSFLFSFFFLYHIIYLILFILCLMSYVLYNTFLIICYLSVVFCLLSCILYLASLISFILFIYLFLALIVSSFLPFPFFHTNLFPLGLVISLYASESLHFLSPAQKAEIIKYLFNKREPKGGGWGLYLSLTQTSVFKTSF